MSEATDSPRAGQGREQTGRWLFERDFRENGPGASPTDAPWEEWVDRNREQWRQEADALADHLVTLGWTPPATATDAGAQPAVTDSGARQTVQGQG